MADFHLVPDRANRDSGPLPLAEARYQALFAESPVGIHVSLPDGTLIDCNHAFARMLGFPSPAEAIGGNLRLHVNGRGEEWLARVREHGRVEQERGRLWRKDGRILQVMASMVGVFDRAGTLIEVRGFAIDVTRSAEAAEQLTDRERCVQSVFVDAADAMLILDDDRRVIDANHAACIVFGDRADRLIGRRLDAYVLPEDREQLAAGWRELLAFGVAKRELHLSKQLVNGDATLLECSYRAAVHEHGHICIARDITNRRLLEERLIQSEKLENIGRLAGGIAHDFNNLLTAILGYTELLLTSRCVDDRDGSDLREIKKAGQRAAALTQRLLAYSRRPVLVPMEVDLNDAIGSLRGMLARLIRADISLTCALHDGPALIKIDPTQLEQVVINLVLNARDALPGGGAISLEVARVRLSEVEVPADQPTPAGEYVRLKVSDNGVGISPEARAHLFEPLFTTKELDKGSGLGLAAVYGIVRQSNGFISVDSEPGKGTTFGMHFPALASATDVVRPGGDVEPAAGGRETILVVEDEDSVRVLVGAILRRHGYHVLEAATAHAACAFFEKHGAEIDLLLSDVVMPDMNGPTLAQRLVGRRPELRTLFMSGYADDGLPIDGGNPNVSFLSKPFQAAALVTHVRELLARPAQEPL